MRRVPFGFGVAALLATASPAAAVEYGEDLWAKSFAGFMSGVLPPQPGFYLGNYYYYFAGTAAREVRNGLVELDASVAMNANFLVGTYVTDLHLLGATYALASATLVF